MVFDTLYLLLSFGHESPEEAEKLDPPFSYFRIRLICSLLETCGQFFNKGLAKKRLDRFLVFFQRYLLAKPPLPLDVEFDVQACPFAGTRSIVQIDLDANTACATMIGCTLCFMQLSCCP